MFRSIVVGTDGSRNGRKAVDEAIDLVTSVDAAVRLVSAYEPVPREEARQMPGANRISHHAPWSVPIVRTA